MLRHTRIAGKMDVQRLGASMARPGLDTRVWVSQAIALGESEVDPEHGVFVDVVLLPSREKYTARVPADYSGNGFGFYARIHKDDSIIVAVPNGDPSEGLVVLARLWSAADLPPQQAVDDPDEVMLVIEEGVNLRIATSGGGIVTFTMGANMVLLKEDKIELGANSAADKASLDSKIQVELSRLKSELDAFKATFDGHTHPYVDTPVGAAVTSPTTTPFPAPGNPAATNSELVTIDS